MRPAGGQDHNDRTASPERLAELEAYRQASDHQLAMRLQPLTDALIDRLAVLMCRRNDMGDDTADSMIREHHREDRTWNEYRERRYDRRTRTHHRYDPD